MTFTYVSPDVDLMQETRFYCQDTDPGLPLMQDEEIQFLLDEYLAAAGSVLALAALTCEIIAAKFARQVSTSADGVSVGLSELQGKYNDLADSLRSQHKSYGGGSFAAALDDMFNDLSPFEVKPLVFGVGFMDNYLAGQQDFGYYSPGDYPWGPLSSPVVDALP